MTRYAISLARRIRASAASTSAVRPSPCELLSNMTNTRATSPRLNTTASDTRNPATSKPRRKHAPQERPAGRFLAHTTQQERRRDRDSNPGHLNGATAFETAALPLCHPANNTTIALIPTTRKHSGGDEQHGAVNNPRKSVHLYRITTGTSPRSTRSPCSSTSVKTSPSSLVHT